MVLKPFRMAPALLALALVITSCGDVEVPDGGTSVSPPSGRGTGARDRIDDLGPLGSAARPILRPKPFGRILIEVAFVEGRRPSESALRHVDEVLSDVSGKDVDVSSYEIPAQDGSYTAEEIRRISAGRRKAKSDAPRAVIWVGYLNGGSSENDRAVGIATAATVAAIFPDKLADGPLTDDQGLERAVLLHEVGHILALVEIGYDSSFDRQDPERPHHSKNEGSVMHWAVESASVLDVFGEGPPDDFDRADRADLEKLGQA